ncbi:MAG: metallophosphoesterase [Nannocystaceae bacterium]
MTARSFSLGRVGEARWEQLRAGYLLARRRGAIMMVIADSRDVRDEVRRRLTAVASRLEVIEPSGQVVLAIHELAKGREEGDTVPVAWIEAPAAWERPEQDMRWFEALAVLNQTRDLLQDQGPCHVVLVGPKALHPVISRRAPDVTSFINTALLLDDTLEELVTEPTELTWMHLSDLHVGGEDWQRDDVLRALVRDLPGLLEDKGLRPDLLFVTGDVANRGTREEYDGALEVLEQVTGVLGLEPRHSVFAVAGNHDVDRGRIGRMVKRDHASLIGMGRDELRTAVGELLGDAKEFELYGERLGDWCDFTNRMLGLARSVSIDRPWRSDVVEVAGLRVGVLSLCTAWSSGSNARDEGLLLGERQLAEMVQEAKDGGAQLVIALMHHPWESLHPEERSQIRGRLEREVDLVLHGHTHDAHSAVQLAAGSTTAFLGAGAAYARLGQDPYHGFSVGRLHVARGELEIHHFTWSTSAGKWHVAPGVPGADDSGCTRLAWAPAGVGSTEATHPSHEVLASRLRRAAKRVYSTFDLGGLGAGGTRHHATLDDLFVPLRLTRRHTGKDDEHIETGELVSRLGRGERIVVLGDPGSGKSTLCKHITTTLAAREGGPVPLLLTVRDWIAEGKREGLLEMAAREATRRLSVRTDEEALERLCEQGTVVLIVDGVDEAADLELRRGLRDRVHGFAADRPNIPILVTSRITGYDECPIDEREFERLSLEPFDDEAIELFVRRWYDVVEPDDPTARMTKRVSLMNALEREPRAKALARNPLLATLIAMVHVSQAQLPGDRAKLYGMIVHLLLVTWPADRKRELPQLHGAVQQPMLERLALRLQEQRAETKGEERDAQILVDGETLERMLAEQLLERSEAREPAEVQHLAKRWARWLVHDSGLLQEHLPGRFGFLHLSVMEYLAGRALFKASSGGGYEAVAELVVQRHAQAVWRETLLLMLGSENDSRELAQVVTERLLDHDSEPWDLATFAVGLLRENVDVGPALRGRTLAIASEACLDVLPREWNGAKGDLDDVVRFGRVHGQAVAQWFSTHVERSKGEELVGALTLLPPSALSEDEAVEVLSAREDAARLPELLDFDPRSAWGRFAWQHTSKQDWLASARVIPIEGIVWRSFAVFGPSHGRFVWPVALLRRASWISASIADAAMTLRDERRPDGGRGLPRTTTWLLDDSPRSSHQVGSSFGMADDRRDAELVRFSRFSSRFLSLDFSRFLSLDFSRPLSRHLWLDFSQDLSLNLSLDFSPEELRLLPPAFPQFALQLLSIDPLPDFSQLFSRRFSQLFSRRFLQDSSGHTELQLNEEITAPALPTSSTLQEGANEEQARQAAKDFLLSLIGEAHAALVTAPAFDGNDIPSALIQLRSENHWLHLNFTPLVEHATKDSPLDTNPDLHALLLTLGLAQYQTTWQWPDCPHWRSWLSTAPPTHWLPAHIFHLIRSIQDPTNPAHREQANAALSRADWPQLADALREYAVVPTPPEVLALFDDGTEPS